MAAYGCAIGIGQQVAEAGRGGSAGGTLACSTAAYWLVLNNIRRMLGLDRCRMALTGAAPISPELIRWYLALGISTCARLGQTENCGAAPSCR
jgi:long-chain acyl-CoA synthetase